MIALTVSFHSLNCPPLFTCSLNKSKIQYRTRFGSSIGAQISAVMVQSDGGGNFLTSPKILSSGKAPTRCRNPNSLLRQANTVGIIGGASVFSTLIFLEKLVWWSSREGEENIPPFIICSDPAIARELALGSSFPPINGRGTWLELNHEGMVMNLRDKRAFLEQSGVKCIVMPCHISHAWLIEVSEGCSVPFLNVGDCVAMELKEAKLKPIETGSNVKIGVLAADANLLAGFYQAKLQSQGFEVVLPDKATMEHTIFPAIEAMNRKDLVGARNLLRIAIQVLLVRAVNYVILASDEFHGLLPRDDPVLKKCLDPMDALARSTVKWAKSILKVQQIT